MILKAVVRIAAGNRVGWLTACLTFFVKSGYSQNPIVTAAHGSPNLLAMALGAAFAQGPVQLHLRLGRGNRNQVAAERP